LVVLMMKLLWWWMKRMREELFGGGSMGLSSAEAVVQLSRDHRRDWR
jgi:hypothetical protein